MSRASDEPVATKAVYRKATVWSVLMSPRAWVRFFRDKRAPIVPKVVALLALMYVVSPIDLLPDFIVPIACWLDDLGVATIASAYLASVVAKYQNAAHLPTETLPMDPR
jgi:uncharacterized membrane protein YkvA (DUF1232 family)